MARCSGRTPSSAAPAPALVRYADLGRSAARQNDARRSAVHRGDVDAEEIHARRTDEGGDELVRRRVVKLERRADLGDDPLVENDDLVGESHRLRLVMRHIDHRRAELGMKLRQFKAHLHAQFRVEVGQRLVEQENLGLAHERPADRDPLALAARKLGRTTVEIGLELQDARDFERALVLHLSRLAGDGEREGDVLPHRHMRVERVGLEHHGDAPLRRRHVGNVDVVDEALAGRDRLESGDHPEQRRLAAAGRAEQRGERAFIDREAEIGDRGDRAVAFRHPPQFDMGRAAASAPVVAPRRSSLDPRRQHDRLRHPPLENEVDERDRQRREHGDREIARRSARRRCREPA